MNFPRNSAFTSDPHDHRGVLKLTPPPSEPVIGSTRRLGVTEVPNETLESWYNDLDDFTREVEQVGGDTEAIGKLRDQVYSYLRG